MGFPYRRIVFLFGGRLREPVNRSQQLARYFADTVPVLYVPYGSFRHWLDREWRHGPWQPLSRHPQVRLLGMPSSLCLGRRSGSVALLHALYVTVRLRRWLAAEGLRDDEVVLFVYSPVAAPVLRWFPRTSVHYDCADDHEEWWGNSPHMRRLNARHERAIVRRARTVTATSEALLAKMRGYHDRVFLVPNGVDWEHFATPPDAIPGELSGLPRPILGFVGVKAEYLDWDLVEQLVHAQVGSLVFVGPGRRFQARFAGRPNVHFLGPRPYADLPRYVHAFDVGLIPANRAPAAVAASPSKLFQYLATGKPVVATDLPELSAYRDVIHVADTAEAFIDKVREALEKPTENAAQRRELAHAASWQRRAQRILDIVGTHAG